MREEQRGRERSERGGGKLGLSEIAREIDPVGVVECARMSERERERGGWRNV